MDELDARLRGRLERLAAAVPVASGAASPRRVVPVARPAGGRLAGSATLAAATILVIVVAAIGLIVRSPGPVQPGGSALPAGSPIIGASPSPPAVPASPSSSATASTILRIDVLVEEPCPQTEGGRCHYDAVLTGSEGRPTEMALSDGATATLSPGRWRLALEARLGSDVIANGSAFPGGLDAACEASFTVSEATRMVVARAVFRRGSCLVSMDDGSPAALPTETRPPAAAALPHPEGCPAYRLSPRRCAYIVGEALRDAGLVGQPAQVELLGDPLCVGQPPGCGDIRLSVSFVVRVRVTPPGGAPFEHSAFCGIGGEALLRCTDTPRIRVSSPVMGGYHDVPCSAEGGDGPCASSVPTAEPAAIVDAVPLEVPSITIPIDHAGDYAVVLGEAVLPNGILSEATATLADDTRSDLLVPEGIWLQIVGGDGAPLVNAYDHGWRPGTERVTVRLVFTVESFEPGTELIVTDIAVG